MAPASSRPQEPRGGEKEDKDKKELKERIISAIKQHNNFRGKPMGSDLPKFLKDMVEKRWFATHCKGLRNDNALAEYGLEQVRVFS